jgi:hypothetical protein
VAVGDQALVSTSGSHNTGLGSLALNETSTGGYNTAVGSGSLQKNTTATGSTAAGYQAGYSNTTGTYHTAVGHTALYSNTTGTNNNAFGHQALRSNTTGNFNTALGLNSLYSNTTASDNTATGVNSMYSNTTGNYNVGLGKDALRSNTTASNNTAMGEGALYLNTTGEQNTALGRRALYSQTSGLYNTAVGLHAGYYQTGSWNTFIGHDAGSASGFTGSKNTILGRYNGNQGGLDIRTSSNNIVLSDGDGNVRYHVRSDGKTMIGPENTAPASFNVHTTASTWTANFYNLNNADVSNVGMRHDYARSGQNATQIYFMQTNGTTCGSIKSNNSSTSYNTSSDYRLKENVVYDWDATTRLKQLKPARFTWIDDGDGGPVVDGFLAHEAQMVVPEAVQGVKDAVDAEGNPKLQEIDQSKLVPLLVKTIQELEARITALENA